MAETIEQTGLGEAADLIEREQEAQARDRKTTGRIAGAALIVMIGTIFSRVVAIPRESLIASMFGDSTVTALLYHC